MTDTLQALQRIGDGDFEKLAVFFLRRRYPELDGIIATGINEEDKSIACPVDGITYIHTSDNSPRCIALAFTTFKIKDARRKWLGGKNYKGDIDKAEEEFRKWRQDDQNIDCVLFLAINQLLKNDTNLYREAVNLGRSHGIEVKIIEASILTDFLDNDSNGEYIREKILGIKAKRLSDDLLRNIAKISICEHQRIFGKDQTKEIIRELHLPILNLIEKPNTQLIGLRGASGVGKSTLLNQIGRRLNDRGDVAIWIPHDAVESGISLANLLSKVLKRFYPTLGDNVGSDALHLLSSLSCKVVLLVDDINRSSNPLSLIDTLEFLTKDQKTDSLKLVVPLWLGQLSARPNNDHEQKIILWEEIELDVFSISEKEALLQKIDKNFLGKANQIIETLNGDPFLCGTALESEEVFSNFDTLNLIEKIFTKFLAQVAESSRTTDPNISANEFKGAISDFVELTVSTNNPEPEWEQVCNKLENRKDLLRNIAAKNKIGWIDRKSGLDFWRWKHDKIRDALVGRWLANKILVQSAQKTIAEQNQELLSNLGLAEAWTFSLAFLSKKSEREKAVYLFAKHQPLALAELLRLNLFPVGHEIYQLAAEHLQQILIHLTAETNYSENIVRQLILEKLSQTNNLAVLQATEGLQGNDYIWAARFRNGDITAAIEWINHEMTRGWFLPKINHSIFEQALERFTATFSCNRDEPSQKILKAMEHSETSVAAITLAGYLTWTELAEPAWNVWYSLSGRQKLIATVPTIWALSRCGNSSVQHKLEQALLFTHQLRQAADELRGQNEPGSIPGGIEHFWRISCQLFSPSLRWSFTSLAAETWVQVLDENVEVHNWLWDKLHYIDHAVAVETYIRFLVIKTASSSNSRDIQTEMIWNSELSEGFHDPIRQISFPKKAYKNPETYFSLWKIVENSTEFSARLMAFSLWKRGVTVDDIEKLQSISEDDEIFDEVLKVRLKLQDRTAARFLIAKLYSEPSYWCSYVHFLQDLIEVFNAFLNTFDTALEISSSETYHHRLNSVAKYLSVERVRELIGKKHELLMKSPQTWLALWCSDVPEALKLVQEAMVQSDPGDWYLFFFPDESFQHPVSQRMLNALMPVLQKHPVIREPIAEMAARVGFGEWVHEHLPDVATSDRIRYFSPTNEDVIDALAVALEQEFNDEKSIHLVSELHPVRIAFKQRNTLELVVDLQSILETWISPVGNEKQLLLTAKFLAAWGDSRDVDWWQKVQPTESSSYTAWTNTLQVLKRRRWHGVGEFTATP